jgi:hypothetical protein
MDVVGGHHLHPRARREAGQRVVARPVHRIAVVPELHQHAVPAEGVHQLCERVLCRGRSVTHQRRGDRSFATTGEHPPTGPPRARRVGQARERVAWCALLAAHLRLADRPGQPGVSRRALADEHEMLPGRVRPTDGWTLDLQGQLRAEDGGETEWTRGHSEADHAVETVMVGDREAGETQPVCFLGELLGVAGPVQKGEVAVAVQLRVLRHPSTISNTCS